MKFANPLSIECPNCGESRKYLVEDLLNSHATCLLCNYSLASIGKEVKNHSAYWKYVFGLFVFLNDLEDRLNIQFEDREVEHLKTLEEVFNLTQEKLSAGNSDEHLKQVILETAAQAGNYTVDQLALEMDIRKVLESSKQVY